MPYVFDAATLVSIKQAWFFERIGFINGRIPRSTKPNLKSMTAVVSLGGAAGLFLYVSSALPSCKTDYSVGLLVVATPQVVTL